MHSSRLLFVTSWLLLLVVSGAILFLSLVSTARAYRGRPDNLTTTVTAERMTEIGGEEAVNAFRGRRITAATWALAYSLLSVIIVLLPYRRGERWAWWALLCSIGFSQLLSIARVIVVGTAVGASASGLVLCLFLLGLMAGAPRIFFSGRGQD